MNIEPAGLQTEVKNLLREVAAWRLISLLMECPGPDWCEQIGALAAEVGDDALLSAAATAQRDATPGSYYTILGPGGPVACREVAYRNQILPGQFLAELQGFYDAFAYQPTIHEPPDHVAVEAGFVAYLRLKEAYAVCRGDMDQASVAAEALQVFMEEHLATFAEPMCDAIRLVEGCYLQQAANALVIHVNQIRSKFALNTNTY